MCQSGFFRIALYGRWQCETKTEKHATQAQFNQ